MSELQAQRRKMGLCMKCGDKWGKGHKCPAQIPLHVLDELWEAVQEDQSPTMDYSSDSSDADVLSLSLAAAEGIQGRRTIRLHGLIQDHDILLLLDSGSCSTFINSITVSRLGLPVESTTPTQVTAANGGKMLCSKKVPSLSWLTQGYTFSTSARVLDLQHYDIIWGLTGWRAIALCWWIRRKRH